MTSLISRRDFLTGAAAACAAALIPTLAAAQDRPLRLKCTERFIGPWAGTPEARAAIRNGDSYSGIRWVTHEALERGEWNNVSYIVRARRWDGEPLTLISWHGPQPLQRSVPPMRIRP